MNAGNIALYVCEAMKGHRIRPVRDAEFMDIRKAQGEAEFSVKWRAIQDDLTNRKDDLKKGYLIYAPEKNNTGMIPANVIYKALDDYLKEIKDKYTKETPENKGNLEQIPVDIPSITIITDGLKVIIDSVAKRSKEGHIKLELMHQTNIFLTKMIYVLRYIPNNESEKEALSKSLLAGNIESLCGGFSETQKGLTERHKQLIVNFSIYNVPEFDRFKLS